MNIAAIPIIAPHRTPQSLAQSAASTGSSSTTSTNSASSSDSAQAMFLNMLVTELQNQDPTSPMDPTQMVGQMFSMNQLQQLIDINQTLQLALAAGSSSTGGTTNPPSSQSTQAVQGAH